MTSNVVSLRPKDEGVRVLLADDTAGIRFLLRIALETAGGFTIVGEATDGAQAIELAGLHQPDVILLDMGMPVMDGLQAIPEIIGRAPNSKIVVLSGFSADRLAEGALSLGAAAYIEKGIDANDLASRLLEIVGARVA
jgi:DNA-binding NarL/FixJ family response regulator